MRKQRNMPSAEPSMDLLDILSPTDIHGGEEAPSQKEEKKNKKAFRLKRNTHMIPTSAPGEKLSTQGGNSPACQSPPLSSTFVVVPPADEPASSLYRRGTLRMDEKSKARAPKLIINDGVQSDLMSEFQEKYDPAGNRGDTRHPNDGCADPPLAPEELPSYRSLACGITQEVPALTPVLSVKSTEKDPTMSAESSKEPKQTAVMNVRNRIFNADKMIPE